MTNYFIIPGLGNSGEEHWQTYFEKSRGNFQRIHQQEWDAPLCRDWVTAINKAIAGYDPATVVLIAHSLGCCSIAHWTTQYNIPIKGALLVAPSDIENPKYNFPAKGFAPIPLHKINFKTIVVTSSNDYWVTAERAKFFANSWNSKFINIGDAGHINISSGYGRWEKGLEILKKLG